MLLYVQHMLDWHLLACECALMATALNCLFIFQFTDVMVDGSFEEATPGVINIKQLSYINGYVPSVCSVRHLTSSSLQLCLML
jgi:hypothetical protein